MNDQDIIDGWKSISTYLGKSVKTIQRWERESGFPVHRVPGRQSVFAMRTEVDKWLKHQTNPEHLSGDKEWKRTGRFEALFRSRRMTPFALVLITIAAGVIAVQGLGIQKHRQQVLGPLNVEIVPYSAGSSLTVKNGRGNVSLHIKFKQNLCEYIPRTPGTRIWLVSDVNHDGLDDFLMTNPEKKLPGIDIFLQHSDGSLKLKRTINIREEIQYGGRTFDIGKIQFFSLSDIDGDHVPELLVTAKHDSLYPSLLLVITLKGDRVLTMEHPGCFSDVQVQKINGRAFVYVSGTNNFITKFSEPVVLRVGMNWHRRGVRFSLLCPDRKITGTVPKGIDLTYARLGDFPELPGALPWEAAVIRPKFWGAEGDHLRVDVGYYDSRTGKIQLQGSSPVQEIRLFELNEDLSLIYAEYNDVVVDAMGIHPEQEPYCSLLKPHYWNGHDWQDTVCTIPCARTE